MPRERRRVCFVTGTRSEFGLMESTLRALRDHPAIELQLVATGSHVQGSRDTLREMRRGGWRVDAMVPWREDTSPSGIAAATGVAMTRLAKTFALLKSEIVLVVGDRVEAFAAASAAHIGGCIVAHVHGGDRAQGQVDDSLRHAITKLSHVHFTATKQSGERIFKLGEGRSRIHVVGAPGIDGIRESARSTGFQPVVASSDQRHKTQVENLCYADHALVLLHPTVADDRGDRGLAAKLFDATFEVFGERVIALWPNNDPGSAGIAAELEARERRGKFRVLRHLSRPDFLAALRDCRCLIGNSSSGIIEAGSFGTPVLDAGPRQLGRERGPNVRHVEWDDRSLVAAIRKVANQPRTRPADNPYERGGGGAGKRIADRLAMISLDDALRRKVIRY